MPGLLVNIDVPDIEAAVAFYTEALGLKVGRRFDSDFVELVGSDAPFYLLKKQAGSAIGPAGGDIRRYARHWTPIHLDFVVDDIGAAVDRARNAGAKLEGQVRSNNWGKIAMLADPFGHGICLIEFVGRGYDEIAT